MEPMSATHIKEQNYGADWGDFVSFTQHMKHKAGNLGVDLFKIYGERYLTSNVQILNNSTGQFEYIGNKYRYFTTAHGLRIMAFGVLFDFTGNSNVSKVIKAASLVKESWFLDAINYPAPIDLFLVIGHNPVRTTASTSTFGIIYKTIRGLRPNIPIQAFGGHTHVRDFAVYDAMSTGLESGRYCETVGWLSMSGINSSTFNGNLKPRGVPNPTQPAFNATATNSTASKNTTSSIVYQRRYLDFNRLTFAYHAVGSQASTFDYHSGERVTDLITSDRRELNLTALYGCAPETYCQYCKPFGADGNIFPLLATALAATVINESRADVPRLIIINTGSVRFDLVKGPFTFDDSFIVSPFADGFQFIPDVPYKFASQVLGILNAGPFQKKRRDLEARDLGFTHLTGEVCPEGIGQHNHKSLKRRAEPLTRGMHRRQTATLTPGYVTKDDFGTDGDDTVHSRIPNYAQPNDLQANASFPTDGSEPATVDLVFLDFIADEYVIPALRSVGATYSMADVSYYLPKNFTTNSYLPAYAKLAWQANVPNCPVGEGVGFS
ncbi:MAG: hypothetical protein Q9191_001420 [Dirinaria sp. TL-2023a]